MSANHTPEAVPTLADVLAASKHVYQHMKPSPLHHYASLSQLIGAELYIKHENHNPTGAFKVRGGLHLAATLNKGERAAGLFTASTGNHGQSIAYAARAYDIQATVVVPEGANPDKVAAMRGFDAQVLFHGADFDTARLWGADYAEQMGGLFIGPTDNRLIKGVGSYGVEILNDLPDVDTIVVPVGGGSGACATAIVAKTINPNIKIIGVQSAQAPTAQLSWTAGHEVQAPMQTQAEGLATRFAYANTQHIMREYLDDFVLVDDQQISAAIVTLLEQTHNLAEGAGAAAFAGALQIKAQLKGKKVAVILSGGNQSIEKLRTLLN